MKLTIPVSENNKRFEFKNKEFDNFENLRFITSLLTSYDVLRPHTCVFNVNDHEIVSTDGYSLHCVNHTLSIEPGLYNPHKNNNKSVVAYRFDNDEISYKRYKEVKDIILNGTHLYEKEYTCKKMITSNSRKNDLINEIIKKYEDLTLNTEKIEPTTLNEKYLKRSIKFFIEKKWGFKVIYNTTNIVLMNAEMICIIMGLKK